MSRALDVQSAGWQAWSRLIRGNTVLWANKFVYFDHIAFLVIKLTHFEIFLLVQYVNEYIYKYVIHFLGRKCTVVIY